MRIVHLRFLAGSAQVELLVLGPNTFARISLTPKPFDLRAELAKTVGTEACPVFGRFAARPSTW